VYLNNTIVGHVDNFATGERRRKFYELHLDSRRSAAYDPGYDNPEIFESRIHRGSRGYDGDLEDPKDPKDTGICGFAFSPLVNHHTNVLLSKRHFLRMHYCMELKIGKTLKSGKIRKPEKIRKSSGKSGRSGNPGRDRYIKCERIDEQ